MGKSCSGARWCSELGWAQERKDKSEVVYVGRQESGSLRHAMVGGPVAAAEIRAKPQWAVKTGPGATSGALGLDQIRITWGKAVAAPGGVRSEDGRKKGKKSSFLGIQTGRLGPKV